MSDKFEDILSLDRLTRKVFSHLLDLPVEYFEKHSAGLVARHVQQVQNVRNFLTGSLFFTGLELHFKK